MRGLKAEGFGDFVFNSLDGLRGVSEVSFCMVIILSQSAFLTNELAALQLGKLCAHGVNRFVSTDSESMTRYAHSLLFNSEQVSDLRVRHAPIHGDPL